MDQQQLETNIDNLFECLQEIDQLLQPLYKTSLEELSKQLTPLDAAKLYTTVAYVMASVEVAYLRLEGIDHTKHNIMGDLKSIQETMGRITATTKRLEAYAAEEKAKEEKAAADRLKEEAEKTAAADNNAMTDDVQQQTTTKPEDTNKSSKPGKAKKRKL